MSQPLIIGGGGVGGGKQQTTTTTTNSSTTSPQQSSNRLRHFLKFNGPSNNNNNNGDLQQKSNGHIDSKSSQQQQHCNTKPSSPLIGRNYPHQRVTKSPSIESTTTTTTKSSSPLLNRCQVINLNPVNVNNHSKQNSFDHHNTGLSSPNLNNNLQSKQHRHSFRCSTSTTNNNNNNSSSSNQLRQSQHTYDNVASLSRLDQQQQQQQSSSMESSPRFQQNMVANNDDNDDDDDDDDDKHGKQFEWIEIFEPKSRTKMFANLSTGECSWFEPKNVQILRQSNPKITQWWELYDQKSQRFYYYSVKDSKTIWQKPNTVDAIIVPLAKLQIIKQAANNNNSTPLDRIISNSSRTSQPLNNSSSPLSSASSSPSSATNTGRSPQLISPNSTTSICIRCRQRPIMVDSFTQTFNNNNNNSTTSDSIRSSSSSKQSMVSRWTQTTSQTPVDIRRLPDLLSDDLRRQQQQQQQHAHQQIQPSLRHYLLSEARFAARGQTAGGLLNTHPQNNDNDNNRIYDPIAPESIYDPVAQIDDYDDDYFDVDDDELTDYGDDEDDEISFDSCDADDEFGGEDNSYTDDDEDDEDEDLDDDDDESIINVRNDQKGSSSDSHIVGDDDYDDDDDYNNEMIFNRKRQQQQQNQQPLDDYDIVDYGHHDDHQYISSTKSGTNNNRMPAAASGGISRSTLIQQNLDGPLKMSASFTATDFKRNALGRSSYTTSTTTNQQQQPSAIRYEQPSSNVHHNQREQQRESCPKPAYSNPFNNNNNNNGSLRSSTGRINMNLDQSLSNEINNNKGLGSIADRIQLFNQKSTNLPSKTTTPTPTSPKSIHRQQSISVSAYEPATGLSRGFLHRSATTEGGGGGAGGAIAANQVQRFLQQQPNNVRTSISPVLDQSSVPSKSTSMTLISPSSSSSSSVVNTTTIQQQQQQSNDPIGSSSNGKRSSLSNKFPVTSNNNQFDLSFEIPRNNSSISLSPSHQQTYRPFGSSSTPVPSYPIPPPHLHHSAFNQMNDVHKSILVNQANVAASFKNSKNKNSNNQPTTVTKGTANKKNNVVLDSNHNKDQTVTDSKSSKKSSSTTTKTIVKNKDKSNGNNGNNSIESFARECVSRHRKGGIFSKKKTLKSMLMHTKKPLKKPMISTISDALLVKESVACFKIIQIFMGDRSPSPTCQQQQQQQQHSTGNSNLSTSTTTTTNIGERLSPTTTTTLPYNDDQLLVRLINICVQLVPLRDEVLVQVARQVTQNPNPNSERRGLELMCTLFWYFTASNKLAQHLHAFLFGHRNPFTVIVRRKFEQQMYRSRYTHSHLFYRKPHSIDEVSNVLRAVHSKHVGIFGETLADALVDGTKLPWPVVLLTEALLEPRHEDREGVFRCVGDMDDVHRLKMKLDTLLPEDRNFNQMIGRSTNNNNDSIIQKTSGKLTDDHDIHVIASTLKLYFRELRDSIIPSQMYLQALDCAHDPERACALLDQLEPLNRSTLRYLIHFLQIFSTDEFVRDTKMDDANLSMVWAPNILRSPTTNCQQQQQQSLSGPAAAKAAMINSANIYEHTRAEMSFVRTLIQHLPTNNNNNNNGNDTSPKKH
ncbi:Rho GTPase activating protein 39 [Dermatophagoides pteronyssinus]|uniref:Rho GTPase activating protein 39 n=1 Tax=Dermatophagoides pteronyssinus TaxID=6956 RepID=A0ABQ8JLC9_DERPT|nr:Rho GTPase activating protein 39 [Dermatophagoides pteronyssinus]